ncbi:MAG: PEP-CTERM sorting domain-containing protein [Phycisphaerae bacterium]|nr:PEP-CTERM sorting domain-containing protein [Phycisphaerae bacterium]
MAETGKKERRKLGEGFVIIAGVVVFTVSLVFGDYSYTDVYSPPVGEATQAQILSQIYGGSFTQTGVNYSNGTISALRVYDHDDDDIRLDLLDGDIGDVDKVWTDGVATVTAKAKWAGDTQSFGWNQGGLGTGTYEELLTHNDVGGPGALLDITGDFLWGYMPNGEEWWSLNDENYRQEDHMITYKVEGLAQEGITWLLFMEDRPFVLWEGCRWVTASDRDYNDFVVEISAIPEPATLCLLAIGALLLRKRL